MPRTLSFHICIWLLVLGLVFPSAASSQSLPFPLPATFVRITSEAQIQSDGFYLIVSECSGKSTLAHYLLSEEADGKHLRAIKREGACGDAVETAKSAHVWRIARSETGTYTISNAASGKSLYSQSGTDLRADASKRTAWQLHRAEGDEGFLFSTISEGKERYLALGSPDDLNLYFGNYIKGGENSRVLYLYKLPTPLSSRPGHATPPETGKSVALASDGVALAGDGNTLSTAGLALCDGTLSPTQHLAVYTPAASAVAGDFTLQGSDGAYLGYALTPQREPAAWCISNGYIATCEAPARYLIYENGFCLRPSDSEASGTHPATFIPLAAPAQSLHDEADATLTLTGGWSAEALAALSLAGIAGLHLEHIALPLEALPFTEQQPQGAAQADNTIIYIDAAQAPYAPAAWSRVVGLTPAGGEAARLLHGGTLTDRSPLCATQPFSAEAGALTYTRTLLGDGGWETLYLPFASALPTGFEAYACTGVDLAAGTITFAPAEALAACTPYLVRAKGGSAAQQLTLTNLAGSVDATPAAGQTAAFAGTLLPLVFTPHSAYLLSAAGKHFVEAPSGSTLSPFRAYLSLTGHSAAQPLKVCFAGVTTATHGAQQAATPRPIVCALTGRTLASHYSTAAWRALPHGVYLVGGEKRIK